MHWAAVSSASCISACRLVSGCTRCLHSLYVVTLASNAFALSPMPHLCSRLDPATLGVTVLAWGNSLMDYINNTVSRLLWL